MPQPEDRLTLDALRLDPEEAVDEIVERLGEVVSRNLRKRGALVGVSGGIDSSVTAALCVRALGPGKVMALLMPEKESSDDTLDLSRLLVDHLGVESVLEELSPILDAVGCYRRRDEAIQTVVPEYGAGWRAKLVLPSVFRSKTVRVKVRGVSADQVLGPARKRVSRGR